MWLLKFYCLLIRLIKCITPTVKQTKLLFHSASFEISYCGPKSQIQTLEAPKERPLLLCCEVVMSTAQRTVCGRAVYCFHKSYRLQRRAAPFILTCIRFWFKKNFKCRIYFKFVDHQLSRQDRLYQLLVSK